MAQTNTQTTATTFSFKNEEQIVSTQFQLTPSVKRCLSNMLDCFPVNNLEQNWTGLARKLGFDRYVQVWQSLKNF